MKPEYWLARWQEGRIGFHLTTPNPRLVDHHAQLASCRRVLLPLCGKSVDLAWLAMQGHEVIGVELSELAARAFFAERDMEPEQGRRGALMELRFGSVAILVGDFFALSAADVGECDGAFDRAAMIALPPELRADYAAQLARLLEPKASLLLVSLLFDAEGGPPFSVAEGEIRSAYAGARIELADSRDARSDAPGPVARGASFVDEQTYLIRFPDA